MMEIDLEKAAAKITEKVKELCKNKHQATVLVVGSHGYGLVQRAVLGSVSDYCAHHAHCSVMIVKKLKT
ncbi:hypothetical protein like AT2G47710 [Hibiscus trionum]|uniref:UspA domain-containing protein n=1 Tax=Hibiscus trionum TaxID=183268 RepID=A0A9W7JGH0_HIBTR|nr:hypothetical protein like AT2G47710 [Hibiscus trionum]